MCTQHKMQQLKNTRTTQQKQKSCNAKKKPFEAKKMKSAKVAQLEETSVSVAKVTL